MCERVRVHHTLTCSPMGMMTIPSVADRMDCKPCHELCVGGCTGALGREGTHSWVMARVPVTISCTAFTCYLRVPCDERGPHYTLHYVVAWNGLGLGKKNRTTLGGLGLANCAIGTYTSNERLDDLLDNYHLQLVGTAHTPTLFESFAKTD